MTSIIKVDNIQKTSDGSNIIKKCGSTITIGSSGQTVAVACGATTSGMGRTGTVDWCTTAKTSPFTAANGVGYFVNTSGGGVTVTLPSSPSAGNILAIADLNGTFDTNAVTLCRNGSKMKGECSNFLLKDERLSTTIIYSGATQGWITVNAANESAPTLKPTTYNVQYLVVAGGGGGGGTNHGSGGGGGGFRFVACKSLTVNAGTAIPITVGGGGAGNFPGTGAAGSNSVFSTITSTGGGLGKNSGAGNSGGSGSGGGSEAPGTSAGGAGNTPPVSPPQGNNGGSGSAAPSTGSGGGGGAGGTGSNGSGNTAGAGGVGSNSFTYLGPLAPSYGTTGPNPGRYFSGGGGGAAEGGTNAAGGAGGGGQGGPGPSGAGAGGAGTANTGGGGGGGGRGPGTSGDHSGGAGGSGIVVIRHATSDGGSGGNATTTDGSDTIRVFTSDGTFTA